MRRSLLISVVLIGLLSVAGLDYLTGEELSLSLFYAMVVLAVAWWEGFAAAIQVALLSTILHLVVDGFLFWPRGLAPLQWLNEVFRTAIWVIMALIANRARLQMQLIQRQRAQLAESHAQLQADIVMARKVQAAMLTHRLPPAPGYEGALRFGQARVLGGDFHDVHLVNGRLHVCIADVSGKGPPAALLTAMLRGLLDEVRLRTTDPAQMLRELNTHLCAFEPTESAMFITCFFAVWQLDTGELSYASAGHDPALFLRGGKVEELTSSGLPLGIQEPLEIESRSLRLSDGDTLLLYTDGLPNALLGEGKRLGEEALIGTLEARARLSCEELADKLLELAPCLLNDTHDDDYVVLILRKRSMSAAAAGS